MMKMQLPMKTGEKGGDETAEDESLEPSERQHIPRAASSPSVYERLQEPPRPRVHASHLDRESVFEWFGHHLNPAKRIEFMCGLLHMCQPLELRFLGSYLEDLARKDYHVLRDFECRANNPNDLGVLTDVVDPVIRSKLIVCLSLLGSDRRECAGILSRILSSVDLALSYRNYNYSLPPFRDPQHHLHPLYSPCQDGSVCEQKRDEPAAGALEQLALLYTMASLHPAFHFHQREIIRGQLDKIELSLEEEKRQRQLRINAQSTELMAQQVDFMASPVQDFAECTASHPPCQSRRSSRWATQREAVHIEGIVLRGISRTGTDKEYSFEVKWSDSSSSSVTKTHHELENFLLTLPKDQCTESFEKSILRLLSQGDQYESREVEKNLRERFLSAPPLFRQTRKVCSFFTCESGHASSRPACSRCNFQPGKAYQPDCSDASSQDEESYVQGHKKKHGSKTPCQLLSRAKSPKGDSWRGGHAAELNGPTDRRKKISSTQRSSQDTEQQMDSDRRSHPTSKSKSRFLPVDSRDKATAKGKGAAFLTNGSLLPALSPQRKVGSSHPDMFGETSSESCSSPSSPQYRRRQSLESDDDNNKDTDSHSDDGTKGVAPDMFFTRQTDPVGFGDVPSVHLLSSTKPRMKPPLPEAGPEFPPLPYIHSLACVLPNGAADSGLPLVSAPSQSMVPDGKPPMMPMAAVPPVIPNPGIVGDPEKRDVLTTFGLPPVALHSSMTAGVQPLVQRFKTALPHSQAGAEGPPGSSGDAAGAPHQAPLRALGSMSPLPCQDPGLPPSLPHIETPHTKLHGLTLPSGMPSPYSLAPVPTPVMPTLGAPVAPGAAVPPAVPSNSPGPALSTALSLSTAQTDSTSYSNTSASCGSAPVAPGNPITVQQTQQQMPPQQQTPPLQQQQQPPLGCGACGCHNNCGNRGNSNTVGSSSGCQPPLYFHHQMAAVARQMFGLPQSLLYLTQGQAPHQANGPPTLSPFFPAAPPPVHPSPYLHPHSQAEVPSHMMGSQAPVAVAAANYSLQQQMAPAASFSQRVYQHVYPSHLAMLPAAAALGGAGINKKNGTVSCYNCGVNGHFAQDCNQPTMDSSQQGGFRLKYAASNISEALDNAD